jgi:DNA-binding transcriptional ArsR family regulator
MAESATRPRTTVGLRDVRDARELRALAHPVRLALLEELAVGPATATELAERVGESAANCSWHLRQLARYGFIEEAGGGTGRQRPWRMAQVPSVGAPGEADEQELELARDALIDVVLDRHVAAWRRWQARRRQEPAPWRDASFAMQSIDWLTVEELAAFTDELRQLYERHFGGPRQDRLEPSGRPPGSRLVRHVAWAIPDPRCLSDPGDNPIPE